MKPFLVYYLGKSASGILSSSPEPPPSCHHCTCGISTGHAKKKDSADPILQLREQGDLSAGGHLMAKGKAAHCHVY